MTFSFIRRSFAEGRPLAVDEPGLVETAVSVILAPSPRGLETLLIRRAEREGDPWSGHIGLPGGRREPDDPDRLSVAVRETFEEVGVALAQERLLGVLDDIQPSEPARPPIAVRPFVFGLDARPQTWTSDEVAGIHWVELSALAASEATARLSVQGRLIDVPCFRPAGLPEGLVVWGLTYRILRGLLRRASR